MLVKPKQPSTSPKLLGKSDVLLIFKDSAIIKTARTSALSMESAYVECACAIQGGHPMIALLLAWLILKIVSAFQLAQKENSPIWTT